MANSQGQFRSQVWDPFLIISQIVAIQCIFYFFLGLWMFGLDLLVGTNISLQQIFEDKELSFSSAGGRVTMIAFALNSVTCALALWYIVQRAKQCLDFAFTAHFIHLICCWISYTFPTSWIWWLTSTACVTLTTVLSEYLCMRYELKAIPVTVSGS